MAEHLNESSAERAYSEQAIIRNLQESAAIPHSDAIHHACSHTTGGRNLVLCIDGTANQFGDKNTNVIELYNLVLKGTADNQRTWYNSGIGTYVRPTGFSLARLQQFIYHTIDLAIAWDFKRTVLAAYKWLSDNYEPGDCIFLFASKFDKSPGFSRGAFQVRVLSAMIDKVGLIYRGNEMQIPFAYELYADPESDRETVTQIGSSKTRGTTSASRFKKAFSYEDVKVHFVGAWDTVSSIGTARGTHMLPRTVDGMKHVCYFRHALALDERRVKFLPEYAYGGSVKPSANSEQDKDTTGRWGGIENGKNAAGNSPSKRPQTLEVWFAGTHSDIGGGNVENAGMDRSRPPLRWMVFEAGALGLRTAPFEWELSTKEQIEIRESLTRVWYFLELLPLKRLTYTRREKGKSDTRRPHLGSPRKIHEGQKIHSSFLLADKLINGQPYIPKARPLDDNPDFWQTAHEKGLGEWLEQDMYEYVDVLVTKFLSTLCDKNVEDIILLHNLRQIAVGVDGHRAACDGFYKIITAALKIDDNKYKSTKKWELLKNTAEILSESPNELMQIYSSELRTLTRELGMPTNTDDFQTAKQFMERCTTTCIHKLHVHANTVMSVSFLDDKKRIVSGSKFWREITTCIWDAETGRQVGEPLQLEGHTDHVDCIAFSANGKLVASGSDDATIRLWDSMTGKQIGEPFKGHTGYVLSVAFSPDGKRVVSGSDDYTIRIWKSETGEQICEPLAGHTNWVRSVAFSPDGTRIVSSSDDCTIRLWDSQTGFQINQPLTGHESTVTSVAFSPDGRHIVSGSSDKTVRIWDVGWGKQVCEPFQGHTGWVWSVAFSPDGSRVVSGSHDETVRLWDVATGRQVGEPFQGHTGSVSSVMFLLDSKCVVSGSWDQTVRIWDVETYLDDD